jgi:hypothetical protein
MSADRSASILVGVDLGPGLRFRSKRRWWRTIASSALTWSFPHVVSVASLS